MNDRAVSLTGRKDGEQAAGRAWGTGTTSGVGIATKEGPCSTFMPSVGLISEPHQASHAFVHPGHEHIHEWESLVISLAPLHAFPTFISKHHSFQPQEGKCSTKVPVEEGFSPSKFSGEPLKFSSHQRTQHIGPTQS